MRDLARNVAFITGGGSGVALAVYFRQKDLPVRAIRPDITEKRDEDEPDYRRRERTGQGMPGASATRKA